MANNYYDANGVLVLNTVTPLIRALFSGFALNETMADAGEAYIADMSEANQPTWSDILEQLADLVESLHIKAPPIEDSFVGDYLQVIARHYGAENDPVLTRLISTYQFTDFADLETVYAIAERIDDGHGLKAMKIEGCWRCAEPRLFEFGGDGAYFSRHVTVHRSSTDAITLGATLNDAIAAEDVAAAARHVEKELANLLSSIQDEKMRHQVFQQLGASIAQQFPSNVLSDTLRRRGQGVSVWSTEDVLPLLHVDDEVGEMPDEQLAQVAAELLCQVSVGLEEHLASQGNAYLAMRWDQLREDLLQEAREGESPTARQQ